MYLLALGHRLHASACTCADARPNRSAFSSTGKTADQRSNRCSAADRFRGPHAA